MVETTEADFTDYCEYCQLWIDRLHLNDWDYKFAVKEREGADAWASINYDYRKVLLCIVPKREGIESIDNLAKHEVLELLLADVAGIMEVYRSESYVSDEIHKVINRLMRVLQI